MKTLNDLIDVKKGKNALIIGAGSSVKDYQFQINDHIKYTNSFTIGINNITKYFIPEYHLWTNTQRFRTYGKNINKLSNILLGSNIPLKIINGIIKDNDYTLINYTDKEEIPIGYKDGKIYGFYRTAGCLAIMIANLMGASNIYVVGMDGYSRFKYDELTTAKQSQHCYGKGFTDTATWETCIKKDNLINDVLKNLKKYGIDFKIITPTKYGEFYDNTRLYI